VPLRIEGGAVSLFLEVCGLNPSTDSHVIWQVHLHGQLTHCVRLGSFIAKGKGRFGGWTPSQK